MNGVPPGGAAVVQQPPHQPAEVPPPPLPHRRPRGRVREVSSRFMSPLLPSNAIPTPATNPTTAECQRSKSVQRWSHQQEEESCAIEDIPDTTRSLDSTPLVVAFGSHNQSTKNGGGAAAASNSSSHKKYQQRGKRFKENNGEGTKAEHQLLHPSDVASQSKGSSNVFGGGCRASSSRPDTPIVLVADRDRIVPSRYRLTSQSCHRPCVSNINGGVAATSAAAKLLQEATSGAGMLNSCRTSNESNDGRVALPQKKLSSISRSKNDSSCHSDLCNSTPAASTQPGGSCPSSPICVSGNKNRTLSDVRSSMPEVDMLPTVSTRWLAERNNNSFRTDEICNDLGSSKFAASTCSRSLNLPASSNGEYSSSSSSSWLCLRASDVTATYTPSRALIKNQMGKAGLPLHPSCVNLGADARKGRKLFTHQEETHSLKLLYNHYLQWRFTNAKAEASVRAQKVETERQLNCLGRRLSEMQNEVKQKRIKLELLQRMKTLSGTIESQMLYLDQWSAMEEDYSTSLSSVTNSLLNLSLRLPISGEVKVDVTELGETFNSATKVMEMIAVHIERFMFKAEETENLVSDLARTIGGERALIEECRDSLFKVYASEVEECSLRGHLFQLRRGNPCQS